MWDLEWFERAGDKTDSVGIVIKLQSLGFLVLISRDMHKNRQDTTAALENCRNS
jgi:hypothetical protein